MELERHIKETKTRQDRKGNDFLIINTDQNESIFVFHRNVNENRWSNLTKEETRKYSFEVEEGNEVNRYVLLDFSIITESTLENVTHLQYNYVLLRLPILKRIARDFYAGAGYSMDRRWNIEITKPPPGEA